MNYRIYFIFLKNLFKWYIITTICLIIIYFFTSNFLDSRINFFRSDVFGTEAKHNDSSDIDNKSTSESIGITSEKNELASEKIGTTDLKEPINLTETQIKIIEALKKFPEYTAVDLSESVGISRRNIEANIKKLKDLGILVREGSRKDGFWNVVDIEGIFHGYR